MTHSKIRRRQIRMPVPLDQWLEEQAAARCQTVSEVIRFHLQQARFFLTPEVSDTYDSRKHKEREEVSA